MEYNEIKKVYDDIKRIAKESNIIIDSKPKNSNFKGDVMLSLIQPGIKKFKVGIIKERT